ncbi:MAG: CinA family protein [Chloroflexota bacterium]
MADPLVEHARRLQDACLGRGLTVATAESCTGGLVAHLITEVPGSSAYFVGGVVSYSNEVKRSALCVPGDALEAHGAVSAQVALAMAEGARERLGATLAVSVTGVAGPDGGTAAKPVGLVYIAVAGGHAPRVQRHVWPHDREGNKRASAEAALRLLLEVAEASEPREAASSGEAHP